MGALAGGVDLAAVAPLDCTVWYGAGAFDVVASDRAPGIVWRRATELAVLGTLRLVLGAAAAGAGGTFIGGMPGGRTGKLGGIACAGVLDAEVASVKDDSALGAGGGRSSVDGG